VYKTKDGGQYRDGKGGCGVEWKGWVGLGGEMRVVLMYMIGFGGYFE
jgi:hypothetical protein